MTDTLKPVEVSEYYIHRVATGMSKYFWDNIFKEIFDILKDNTVYNSKDDVLNAIRKGSIWYENGAFRGKFNNSISEILEQMGAKFRYNAYYISKSKIPFEYLRALEFVQIQSTLKASRILDFLGGLGAILSKINLKQYIEATVDLMYRKLQLDIVKSAIEKKVPVIELGIVQPKVTYPKTWKERDKKDKKGAGEPPKPDEPSKPGSIPPKEGNKPKDEGKKQEEPSKKGYSLEEIDQYWKEKNKEHEKFHAEWEKSYKKLQKAKKDKNLSSTEFEKLVKAEEKASKELAEFQKDKYQNAPELEITIDDLELDAQSKKVAQDYTYNMKFWVEKWEAKNILKMRQDVLKMVQEGARAERLQEYFEKQWGIAKDKAYFLAKNESHLAGTAIKVAKYQEMGCPGYEWGRSSAKEKRELHKHYYGKFFTWDDKPIIDERLGIRGYPRQIWNCLCHMLIVPPTMAEIINKHKEVRNAKRNIFEKIKYAVKNSTQRNNNSWRYRRFGQGEAF